MGCRIQCRNAAVRATSAARGRSDGARSALAGDGTGARALAAELVRRFAAVTRCVAERGDGVSARRERGAGGAVLLYPGQLTARTQLNASGLRGGSAAPCTHREISEPRESP